MYQYIDFFRLLLLGNYDFIFYRYKSILLMIMPYIAYYSFSDYVVGIPRAEGLMGMVSGHNILIHIQGKSSAFRSVFCSPIRSFGKTS